MESINFDFCSDKIGLTPLHLAICKFDTFVLQFVLHFYFLTQQNPKNQDELTPNHMAALYLSVQKL